MPADYIPGADAAFDAWQANFVSVVSASLADYGLVAGDLTPVTAAQADWQGSYPAHITAQAAAQAARQAKDADRAGYEQELRALVRQIQGRSGVSDAAKGAAGITVRDRVPTAAGPPTTAPSGRVDSSQRLAHTVHFFDSATPTSRARPPGVRGCEIWMKVGPPAPVDPAELAFVTLDSRTPHTIRFEGAEAGKLVTYWLRWVSTRGEAGPWSAAVSATIGA